jgi:hypothetical protein
MRERGTPTTPVGVANAESAREIAPAGKLTAPAVTTKPPAVIVRPPVLIKKESTPL